MENQHKDGYTQCATQSSGGWSHILAPSKYTKRGKRNTQTKKGGFEIKKVKEHLTNIQISLCSYAHSKWLFSLPLYSSSSVFLYQVQLIEWTVGLAVEQGMFITPSVFIRTDSSTVHYLFLLFFKIFFLFFSGDFLCVDLLQPSQSRGHLPDDHASVLSIVQA